MNSIKSLRARKLKRYVVYACFLNFAGNYNLINFLREELVDG